MEVRTLWQHIERRRFSEAEAMCAEILAKHPGHLDIEFARAAIAYGRGNKESALAQVDALLVRAPELYPALTLGTRVCFDLRLSERALELGNRALALRPNDTALMRMVGTGLLSLGRPEEALRWFDAILEFEPKLALGHFGRANAFLQLGSSFDAVEALQRATELDPNPQEIARLAALESALGAAAWALESARRALRKEPANLTGNLVAGRSLTELGEADQAEAYWEAARKIEEAWRVDRHQAFALSMGGRFADAEVCLERSIAAEPRQGEAYQLLFAGRKATEADLPRVEALEELIGDPKLSPDETAKLEFALGKAWSDLGRPDRAIAHWDRANAIRLRAMAEASPFDSAELADKFAVHREVFSQPVDEVPGPAAGRPIFVLGMMRSGTTLVEQILSAHSMVVGAGEQSFWPGSDALLIDRGRRRLRAERVPERRSAYLRLLDVFGGEDTRVVDKNPANVVSAGLLNHIFPDAAIIHLRRDPLDVALSLWMNDASAPFMGSRSNIVFAIRQAGVQAEHWRRILPPNRFLDLRYEDLVHEPERWIRAILEFCGLPWEDGCLRADTTAKTVNTPSVWQVRQPIYRSSVARWKQYEPWLGEFGELRNLE